MDEVAAKQDGWESCEAPIELVSGWRVDEESGGWQRKRERNGVVTYRVHLQKRFGKRTWATTHHVTEEHLRNLSPQMFAEILDGGVGR